MTWLERLLHRLGLLAPRAAAESRLPVRYVGCDCERVFADPAATEAMAFEAPPGTLDRHGHHLAWRLGAELGPPHTPGVETRSEAAYVTTLSARPAGVALLCMASLSCSGYVREEAVRTLGAVADVRALRFLLLRRNDWVAQVRAAAATALDARVDAAHAEQFAREIEFVERLVHVEREDHDEFVQRVRQLVRGSPAARAVLLGGIAAPRTALRRACLAALTGGADRWDRDVWDAAAASSDLVVRLLAIDTGAASLAPADFATALARLMRDPCGTVAAAALFKAHEHAPEAAAAVVESALFDARTPMRNAARWLLRARGNAAFASAYRERLAAGRDAAPVGALRGLAETGGDPDCDLVAAWFVHRLARVRGAAVIAWDALARDRDREPLLAPLRDAAPSVSAAARDALLGRRSAGAFDACVEIAADDVAPHLRRNALRVVAADRPWRAAPALVRACASADPATAELGRTLVRAWARRADCGTPSADEREAVAAALRDAGEYVPADERRVLEWASRATPAAPHVTPPS